MVSTSGNDRLAFWMARRAMRTWVGGDIDGEAELDEAGLGDDDMCDTEIVGFECRVRKCLLHCLEDVVEPVSLGVPQMGEPACEGGRRAPGTDVIRSRQDDPLASVRGERRDEPLAGTKPGEIESEVGRDVPADGDADASVRGCPWEVHRHGLEPEPDGDVGRRRRHPRRGVVPDDELRVDEIRDAVAVTILEGEPEAE